MYLRTINYLTPIFDICSLNEHLFHLFDFDDIMHHVNGNDTNGASFQLDIEQLAAGNH
jgi:hypothetical protein